MLWRSHQLLDCLSCVPCWVLTNCGRCNNTGCLKGTRNNPEKAPYLRSSPSGEPHCLIFHYYSSICLVKAMSLGSFRMQICPGKFNLLTGYQCLYSELVYPQIPLVPLLNKLSKQGPRLRELKGNFDCGWKRECWRLRCCLEKQTWAECFSGMQEGTRCLLGGNSPN